MPRRLKSPALRLPRTCVEMLCVACVPASTTRHVDTARPPARPGPLDRASAWVPQPGLRLGPALF